MKGNIALFEKKYEHKLLFKGFFAFLLLILFSLKLDAQSCPNQGAGLSQDFDCDGVINSLDSDMDGDGIPNAIESPSMFYSAGEANKIVNVTSGLISSIDNQSDGDIQILHDGIVTYSFTFNSGQNYSGATIFKLEYPISVKLNSLTIDNITSFGAGATAKLQGSTDGTIWVELSTADVSLSTTSAKIFSVQQNASQYKFYRILGVASVNSVSTTTIAEVSSVIDLNTYNASLQPKSGNVLNDYDGDGKANHLDLDSDGDGASDAIEGGTAGSTYAMLATNPEINAALDFDNDGIPDYRDKDMDGDGLSNWFEGYVPQTNTPRLLVQYKTNLMRASFHSAFYRARDGGYYIAGQDIVADGTSNFLFPKKLSPQNGFNFTGDIIAAEAAGDQQHLLLTTDGLWSWGWTGQALPSSLAAGTSFRKVTLPAEIDSAKVSMLSATGGAGGATALLMQDGTLWVAVADGGDPSLHGAGLTALPNQFRKVMLDAYTPLSGITDMVIARASAGFAYSAITNTFYTWGPKTYLGDGTPFAKREYATPMPNPLPSGVSVLKIMSTYSTYLVLGSDGRVYSMGTNPGTGSTTPVTSWTLVKNEAGTAPIENVVYMDGSSSYNESTYSIILNNGRLLSWGGDGAGMLGIASGTVFYLPKHPTGSVVGREVFSVKNGGHFTPVIFANCDGMVANTGHNPGGAFGDGTTTDRTSYVSLIFLGDLANFCNNAIDANGNPAWLSLDADKDGCPDNIEARSGGRLYTQRALNSSVNCTDSDGDSISDIDDLDDDNDGVMDNIESPTCYYTAEELVGTIKPQFASISSELTMEMEYFRGLTDGITGSNEALRVEGQTQAGKEIFKVDLMQPTQLDALYVQRVSTTQVQGGNVMFQGSSDGTTWVDLWNAATNPSNGTYTSYTGVSMTNTTKFDVQKNAAAYRFYRILGVATANTGAAWVSEFQFDINAAAFNPSRYPRPSCTNDTDGDGILNHFDPDSDGDGCNDAVESGTFPVGTTIPVAGTTASNYGANGFVNTKETNTESGLYNGSYTYFYAKNSSQIMCVDVDSDGVSDFVDIDNDNDGVLDYAECNIPTDPTELNLYRSQLINSNFHGSIYRAVDGSYYVSGGGSTPNGDDYTFPVEVKPENGYPYTGKILDATAYDTKNYVILTTTGLFTWGETTSYAGYLGTATNITGKFYSIPMPTGVAPLEVKSISAGKSPSGGMLLSLLLHDGTVYVKNTVSGSTTTNGQSLNGAGLTAHTTDYTKVLTAPNTPLTGITYMEIGRYAAFAFDKNNKKFYTWGLQTYLGNGSAVSVRNYATEMVSPLPSGVDPIWIQLNASGTYYVLGSDSRVYTLGDGSAGQTGQNNTTTLLNWATVKNEAGSAPLTDVSYLSAHSADGANTVSVITKTGKLLSWGFNGSTTYMIGAGSTNNQTLPILPRGILATDKIITVENGSHITPVIKEGSLMCNVGHNTEGSFGDGSSGSLDTYTSSYDCFKLPFTVADIYCNPDVDGDGIPNYLDLDSDGDGCSDAFESGSVTDNTQSVVSGTISANGFASSLQTNGNGIYTGAYTYSNATSASIKLCGDADGDGISDLLDIDDDNDGILDHVESPSCFLSPADWQLTDKRPFAQAFTSLKLKAPSTDIQGTLDNISNYMAISFETAASLSNQTIYKLAFKNPQPIDALYFLKGSSSEFLNSSSVKLQGSNNDTAWTDLTTTIGFPTNSTNTTKWASLSLPNSNKISVTQNAGSYKYYRLFGVSGTTGVGTISEVYFDLNGSSYNASYYPKSIACTTGSDNDGVPNHLDLDSDGDGCSDAAEAGTVTSLTATTVAGPYGTNGFADNSETTTESGIYSGTYSYGYATSASVKACTDSDGDGVVDVNDIDNDNDGVLDYAECNIPSDATGRNQFISETINSAFHGSVYKSTDGNFYVSGELAGPSGASLLSPIAITPENGFNYTGRILFARAFGPSNYLILTTTGAYVWGPEAVDYYGPSTLISGNFRSISLPDGVAPTDVKSISLSESPTKGILGAFLLHDGTIYVRNIRGTTGVTTTTVDHHALNGAGLTAWTNAYTQVLTDAGTPLSNISQVVITTNAGFALDKANKKFYTWGRVTYKGDGSAVAVRTLATEMQSPLPAGVDPVWIQLNNGVTYYVLGSDKKVYALGNNTNGETGQGALTPSAQRSWVVVKNEAGTGDLTDVAYLSSQNADASEVTTSVITTSGKLLSWGLNISLTYTILGTGTTSTSLPTLPSGILATDKVWLVENGGHITPVIKDGLLCNVGHNANGAFGDGTTTNSSTYRCSALPFPIFNPYCNPDVDGDGTLNYLDLDSDGDGCSDAFESGTTTDKTQTTIAAPYGNNGFANSLESSTDNGLYKGSYTYQNATTNSVNFCLDSDSDGISDFEDIDDDNDGVLDHIESPSCFMSVGDWNSMDKRSLVSASTDLSLSIPYTSLPLLLDNLSTYSATTFVSAQDIANKSIFKLTFSQPQQISSLYIARNSTTVFISSTHTVRLQGSNDDNTWTELWSAPGPMTAYTGNTVNGAVPVPNGFRLQVNQNKNLYKYYRILGVTGTSGSGAVTEIYFDIDADKYIPSSFPKMEACISDTDNDGVLNHLDLDSDGDGCSDAAEAGTVTSLTATTVAGPYGANGFADNSETATESGVYKSTYTYNFATSTYFKGCIDTDGDGVRDVVDLDDDNDGVLDSVEDCFAANTGLNSQVLILDESGSIDATEAIEVRAALTNWANSLVGSGLTVSVIGMSESDTDNRTDHILNLNFPREGTQIPTALSSWINAYRNGSRVGAQADYWASGFSRANTLSYTNNAVALIITDGSQGSKSTAATRAATLESKVKQIFTIGVDQGNYWSNTTKSDVDAAVTGVYDNVIGSVNNPIQEVTNYDVDFNTSEYDRVTTFADLKTAVTKVAGLLKVSTSCNNDLDNDGIPNQLDLDSDGDGCSDAAEAGTVTPFTATTVAGPYGTNGFADNSETATESGVYKSTYTYNFATNASLKACVDTDGDGVVDVKDLDDDNDGVLDADESEVAIAKFNSFTNGSNLLSGNFASTCGDPLNFTVETTGGVTLDNTATTTATNSCVFNNANFSPALPSANTIGVKMVGATNAVSGTITIKFSEPVSNLLVYFSNNDHKYWDFAPTSGLISLERMSGNASFLVNGTKLGRLDQTTTSTNNNFLVCSLQNGGPGLPGVGTARLNGTFTEIKVNVVGLNQNDDLTSITFATTGLGCLDTDNDGIPNALDLDSDGDGCSDANEYYNSSTADGNDAPTFGTGIPTVDANGKVIAANYTGNYSPATSKASAASITTQPANVGAAVGETKTFSVVVTTGSSTSTYQWEVSSNNGTTWSNVSNGGVYSGATTTSLTITNINNTLFGNKYRVKLKQSDLACVVPISNAALLFDKNVNQSPVAESDAASTPRNQPATGNVLSNDTDPENNTLIVTQFVVNGQTYSAGQTASISGVGTLVINADGTYTFTPAPNYAASVPTATYTVSDGNGGTDAADLSISIFIPNTAPSAINDVKSTPVNTPASGNILTNDADAEGNSLSLTQFLVNGQTYAAGQTVNLSGIGTIVINSNGNYTFTPDANYSGSVPTITYTVSDGNGGTSTADLLISVTAVNNAPVANDDVNSIAEDTPATGNVLSNDIDTDVLTITSATIAGVSTPVVIGTPITITEGTLLVNADGTYTFTPTANYNGSVPTITYVVSDGTATDTAELNIAVTPVNDAPVAADDAMTATENQPASFNLLTNDTDPENDVLVLTTFTIDGQTYDAGETVSIPGVGTVVISSTGSITFTPELNFSGTVTQITYEVSDGKGGTDTGELTITMSPVNDAPIAVNDIKTATEDIPVTGNLLTNDSDIDSPSLTVTSATIAGVSTPVTIGTPITITEGTLLVNADGTYTFTPTANYNGSVPTITYVVSDGTATGTAELSIDVKPVNDAPVSAPDTKSTTEGSQATGNVLTNDKDVDGDVLSVTQFKVGTLTYTAGQTALISGVGELTLNADGTYTFVPAPGYNGTVPTVTYTLSDGHGGTGTNTLDISVTPVNDPPVALTDLVFTPEDTPVSGSVLTNDSDVDSGTLTITSYTVNGTTVDAGTVTTITGVGDVIVNADGSFTFTPTANYTGSIPVVTYVVTDGSITATADLLIKISPATNDVPTAVPDAVSLSEDTSLSNFNVLTNDSDADGDVIELTQFKVKGVTYPAGSTAIIPGVGTLVISSAGTVTFVPEENYNGNVPEVIYTTTDGVGGTATSTLNITVTPVNDAPKALPDTEDTSGPVSGALLTNDSDIDADVLTVIDVVITGVSTPVIIGTPITIPEGTLVVNTDGSYTFTPTGGYDGSVPTIIYTVSDGKGGTASSTLDILVTSLPDPPLTATAVVETTPEDTPITDNVILGNVSGGTATPTLTEFTIEGITYKEGETASIPGVGVVVMYADGSFTFTPSLNYNGAVPTITYKIVDSETDGEDGIAVSTLNINVTPVNDAPVALTDNATTEEDKPASGNVLTNDSDVDSGTLTVTSFTVSGTTNIAGTPTTIDGVGDIVVNADGSFTFTPTANYAGPVPVVSYVITDGTATATADLKLSITAVNDVPMVTPDTKSTAEGTPASGNVLTNDSDVDGDALTLTQYTIGGVTYTAGQTATIVGIGNIQVNANGTYTFTPTTGYNGTVPTITYTASDGNGGTATSTLNITVTPVNDPPVALTDVVSGQEDTPATGNVLTNDSDVDSGTLTVTSFTVSGTTVPAGNMINIPDVGDITVNEDGSFTFTPTTNYNGTVPTITYTVSDGTATATADLKLSITAVNDAPVPTPDTKNVEEDTPVSGSVLTNDSDVDGDALTLTQYSIDGVVHTAGQPATITGVGTIIVSADGSYTFTPTANYNGAVPTITYSVSDGNGGTATSTLNITVMPVNDSPVALDDSKTLTEDTPATGTLLTNDSDPEGATLTVTTATIAGVSTPVAIGTPITISEGTLLINADGTYTFTPTTNYNGTVPTITYTVSDGTATATADLKLSITAVNDAPVVKDETETTPQNTAKSDNLLTNDTDPEGKTLTITGISINSVSYNPGTTVNIPNVGSIVVNANGSYTFTPLPSFFGTVPEVTYTVSDGDGGTMNGKLNIEVTVIDSDGDGIPDAIEKGPDVSNPIDTDNDGTPDYLDKDSDGDGIPDSIEDAGCNGAEPCTPTDTDNDGTPDYLDVDSDGDGIPDAIEDKGCTGTAPCTPTDTDGDNIPDYLDLDSDGDGIPDAIEKGADGNNPIDTDNDGTPDYLDLDSDGDGIPDAVEAGADPENPVDTDGDKIPDYLDLDSDGDGIPDAIEKGADGNNPVDTDKDGTPDYLDLDSDNDGIPDAIEAGADPENPVDTDGDKIPDYLDLDSDGDGIPDAIEKGADGNNPVDTDKDGTPDYLDLDSDGDGIPDAIEKGADGNNPVDTDKDGTPDYLDLDSDGDGIPDAIEKGADGDNPVDTDKDGTPDYLDLDSDGDGIPDAVEAGADPENPVDTDGDKVPDYLDLDSDGDGIPDAIEKGADGNNPVDTDKDGTPDYLDLDSDGDGIPDAVEAGADPENPVDTDGDKVPDYLDLDSDGDGIPDSIERGADGNNPVDTDKDGTPDYLDLDSDGDGIPDAIEDKGCTGTAPCTPTDTDGDKIPDYLDLDSDGDGIPDAIEKGADGNNPVDTDKDGTPDYLDLDSDGDGIPDATEDKGCTGTAPCTPTDTDGDGIPDYLDLDSDGDGITDLIESGLSPALDQDGDGMIDNQVDTDMDGLPDGIDPDNGGKPAPVPDTDGDGKPDYLDLDSDNDGIPDLIEAGIDPKLDANKDGVIDNQTDTDNDGLADAVDPDNEGTPAPVPDTDGDGHPDFQDLDSDNDGILDSIEKGPDANNPIDTDGDGTPDYLDLDSDGDGITDLIESGLSPLLDKDGDGMIDDQKDTDGDGLADVVDPDNGGVPATVPDTDKDGIPDYLDLDSDGDGITDLIESGLSPLLDKDGDGMIDDQKDTDGDGLPDVVDPDNGGKPAPVPDTDGDGKADFREVDSDNDGIPDLIEAGVDPKLDANGDGMIDNQSDTDNDGLADAVDPDHGGTPALVPDTDGDGKPNFQDIDSDGDGIPDSIEKGADGNNPVDTDKDGTPDYLDLDSDNDGILDALEKGVNGNSPVDTDNDGIPDYRDLDSDNDGLSDVIEADGADENGDGMADGAPDANGVPFSARGGLNPPDTDKDGKPDFQDVDSDGDGIPDHKEGQGTYVAPTGKDSDGDGLDDAYDKDSGGTPIMPADTDSDGRPDFRELDSDNDGIPDAVEAGPDPKNPLDTDGDGTPDYRDLDSDNDGIPDTIEKGADGQRPVDTDGDGTPDYRDLDADGDGQPDSDERGIDGLRPLDSDGNGIPDFLQVDDIGEPEDIILSNVSVCYGTTATLEPSTTTVPNAAFKWYSDPALTNLVWAGDFYTTPVVTRTMKFYVTVNGTNVKENRPYNAKEVTVTPNAKFTAPVVSADGELKICSDEERKLSVVMPTGSSVQWYKDGAAISGATKDTLTVNQAGSYTAILTSSTGCVSDPSAPKVIAIVCQTGIMMPDVFTPNGDGDNDEIMPIVPGIKRLRCFEVYNRWGNLIFTTDQMGKGWDGTFRGKHQPAETYLWNIEGVDSKGRKVKKTGMFTLIR